jgi:hypothetical protein
LEAGRREFERRKREAEEGEERVRKRGGKGEGKKKVDPKKRRKKKLSFTSGHELHRDGQVFGSQEDLLELHHVRVHEHAVVEDLALDVLGDLFFLEFFFSFQVF